MTKYLLFIILLKFCFATLIVESPSDLVGEVLAIPADFGRRAPESPGIFADAVLANPITACTTLINQNEVKG